MRTPVWSSAFSEGSLRVLTLNVEKPFFPQQRPGVNHVTFKSGIPPHVESYGHELRKVKRWHGLIDVHLCLTTVEVYMTKWASERDDIRTPRARIGQYIATHLEHDISMCQ